MAWLSWIFLRLFRSRCILATYCRPAYYCWRCNFGMASCNPCSNSSNSWCRTGVFCREEPVFRYLTAPGGFISWQTGGRVLPKCVLLSPCPAPRSNSSVLGIKYRAGAHPHGYSSISSRDLYRNNPGQFCVCLGWVAVLTKLLTTGQTPDFNIPSSPNMLLPLGALGTVSNARSRAAPPSQRQNVDKN